MRTRTWREIEDEIREKEKVSLRDYVIRQRIMGVKVVRIAERLRVSRQRLYYWMAKNGIHTERRLVVNE